MKASTAFVRCVLIIYLTSCFFTILTVERRSYVVAWQITDCLYGGFAFSASFLRMAYTEQQWNGQNELIVYLATFATHKNTLRFTSNFLLNRRIICFLSWLNSILCLHYVCSNRFIHKLYQTGAWTTCMQE